MRFLLLGTSNDIDGFLPEEQRLPAILQRRLEATVGEKVTAEARNAWPSERLTERVEQWMDESEPDLVLFKTNTFAFAYESVPLKLRRKFGRVGESVANAGRRSTEIGWLASNPAYHAGRRFAMRVIGGATNFTPEEVVERMESAIRIILRREEAALVVRGPMAKPEYLVGRGGRARGNSRRDAVDQGLAKVCRDLHVSYLATDRVNELGSAGRLGDQMHLSPAALDIDADELMPFLIEAWAELHPGAIEG